LKKFYSFLTSTVAGTQSRAAASARRCAAKVQTSLRSAASSGHPL
jgi:hypothetical protein